MKAVLASQVDRIKLVHKNKRIETQLFSLLPKEYTFLAKIPDPNDPREELTQDVRMKALQLPIISNNATTGHKLQGCSIDKLFVHQWSNVKNWNYVVLSRVRRVSGLLSRFRLPANLDTYSIPEMLTEMISTMEQKRPNSFAVRHALVSNHD